MAEVIGSEIDPFVLWVQSAVNPADDGSRGPGIRRSELALDPLVAEALRRVPHELPRPLCFADVGRRRSGENDRVYVVMGPNGSGRMVEVSEFVQVRCVSLDPVVAEPPDPNLVEPALIYVDLGLRTFSRPSLVYVRAHSVWRVVFPSRSPGH